VVDSVADEGVAEAVVEVAAADGKIEATGEADHTKSISSTSPCTHIALCHTQALTGHDQCTPYFYKRT